MAHVCRVVIASVTKVTVVKLARMFAQIHAAATVTASMVLACAMLVGVPATVLPLDVVAATELATHQMLLVCATMAGRVRSATLSWSVQTQLVPATVSAPTVGVCVVQDIAATHVNQMSGVATVCAENMGHVIWPRISVCVVVVGLDRGAMSKKERA